jgi:hypothetical protein
MVVDPAADSFGVQPKLVRWSRPARPPWGRCPTEDGTTRAPISPTAWKLGFLRASIGAACCAIFYRHRQEGRGPGRRVPDQALFGLAADFRITLVP